VLGFLILSVVWACYRFINQPMTLTMLGTAWRRTSSRTGCRSTDRPGHVRAVIGAEDSKFCTHDGFDWDAISDAARRNASRIRGGSTISQQTRETPSFGRRRLRTQRLDAWFTFLIENRWSKQRSWKSISHRETASHLRRERRPQRYYNHDASAMRRT
jgi:monofunctional biosynthetic peptidoglycan transglycosylase